MTGARSPRILVAEDEQDIADLLALHLKDFNAEVRIVGDGALALQLCQEQRWDLLLLDLRLPGMEGLDVCRRLRHGGHRIPILMLTSKSSELDRVLGLEVGADDYVTKPFSVMEVTARVKALLRRIEMERSSSLSSPNSPSLSAHPSGHPSQQPVIRASGLTIDIEKREVLLGAEVVELTAREFDLLAFFCQHPGKVFRRMQLLDKVWGYGHEGYEHTVNSHINRLRAKLQRNQDGREYIKTVWGVGYKFDSAPAA